ITSASVAGSSRRSRATCRTPAAERGRHARLSRQVGRPRGRARERGRRPARLGGPVAGTSRATRRGDRGRQGQARAQRRGAGRQDRARGQRWRRGRAAAAGQRRLSVKDVRILHGELSPGIAMTAFSAAHSESGGVVSFLGKVRPDGNVEELELKHYAPLTLKGMVDLADAPLARWPVDGIFLRHRTGARKPGDAIVLVAAAARQRRDAFEAADFAMEHLMTDAWFWKREKRADG